MPTIKIPASHIFNLITELVTDWWQLYRMVRLANDANDIEQIKLLASSIEHKTDNILTKATSIIVDTDL